MVFTSDHQTFCSLFKVRRYVIGCKLNLARGLLLAFCAKLPHFLTKIVLKFVLTHSKNSEYHHRSLEFQTFYYLKVECKYTNHLYYLQNFNFVLSFRPSVFAGYLRSDLSHWVHDCGTHLICNDGDRTQDLSSMSHCTKIELFKLFHF